MLHILYISYDGMTDPLGQSQVIPYLQGIVRQMGCRITLLSCEKPERFAQQRNFIYDLLELDAIEWKPIFFTVSSKPLDKFRDLWHIWQQAVDIYNKTPYQIVHCRSYVAGYVGTWAKKRFGIKLLFDMRGFWVDERVEGGIWDMNKRFYKIAYRFAKSAEAHLIRQSDAIVCLTDAAKREIENWAAYKKKPVYIEVIPCSADFAHFLPTNAEKKREARILLGINEAKKHLHEAGLRDSLVLCYVGSLGTWYMLDEMLALFAHIKRIYTDARFLFLTHDTVVLSEKISKYDIPPDALIIRSAQRAEMPLLLCAADILVSFIKPSYAKKASSPVKMGEALAVGIPLIVNNGVGDVAEVVQKMQCGVVIDIAQIPKIYDKVLIQIPQLLEMNATDIRKNAEAYYLLDNAIDKYVNLYKIILKNK